MENVDLEELRYGQVSLSSLHPYVQANFEVPKGRGLSKYNDLIVALTSSIPESPGLYSWGRPFQSGWQTIYVGKAGHGKTASLRNRIWKELHAERTFLWVTIYEGKDDEIAAQFDKLGSNYRKDRMPRHVKKKDSLYILWVETPFISDSEIKHEEKCLIGYFHPRGNGQRARTTDQDYTKLTLRIIEGMKSGAAEIVGIKPSDFDAPEDVSSTTTGLMRRKAR